MVTTNPTTRPLRSRPAEPVLVGRLRLLVSQMRALAAVCDDLLEDLPACLPTERALTTDGLGNTLVALTAAGFNLDQSAAVIDAYL